MLDIAVKLCREALEFFLKKNELDRQHRERVSNLLDEISEILQYTANDLRKDIFPHGNCQILSGLSVKLKGYLNNVVPEEDLNKLMNALMESSQVETQFAIRQLPDTIPTIEKAAGEFKIMSMLLKVR
jgi:hypothetical protein